MPLDTHLERQCCPAARIHTGSVKSRSFLMASCLAAAHWKCIGGAMRSAPEFVLCFQSRLRIVYTIYVITLNIFGTKIGWNFAGKCLRRVMGLLHVDLPLYLAINCSSIVMLDSQSHAFSRNYHSKACNYLCTNDYRNGNPDPINFRFMTQHRFWLGSLAWRIIALTMVHRWMLLCL